MWFIQGFISLAADSRVREIIYDACMNGGCRPKRQKLLTFLIDCSDIEALCDMNHEHKPWGFSFDKGFDTATEAEYPDLFCDRICASTAKYWNLNIVASSSSQNNPAARRANVAAMAAKQARGRKIPNVMSEYKMNVTIQSAVCSLNAKKCITADFMNVPEGSKLLLCRGVFR